jgi:hypothetical protein
MNILRVANMCMGTFTKLVSLDLSNLLIVSKGRVRHAKVFITKTKKSVADRGS